MWDQIFELLKRLLDLIRGERALKQEVIDKLQEAIELLETGSEDAFALLQAAAEHVAEAQEINARMGHGLAECREELDTLIGD